MLNRRIISLSCMLAFTTSSIPSISVFAEQNVTISSIPTEVVSAQIIYNNTSWEEESTGATINISNGKATVSNLTEEGYYTIVFYTQDAEVGSAKFFLGGSGSIYSWKYNKEDDTYVPDYTKISNIKYEPYDSKYLLSITGNYSVKITDVADDVTSVKVNLVTEDGWGYYIQDVTLEKDNSCIINNLGLYGDYSLAFYSKDTQVGRAIFRYTEDGIFIAKSVYDEPNNEWTTTYESVSEVAYDDNFNTSFGFANAESVSYSFDINGTSGAVNSEIQYSTLDWLNSQSTATIDISGNTATLNDAFPGYYTITFFDSNNQAISYVIFGIDMDGNLIDSSNGNSLQSLECLSIEQPLNYTYGDISIKVNDIPNDIEEIQGIFLGDNTDLDSGVTFEPTYEYGSNDTMTFNELGSCGTYYINFYSNDILQGYIHFYISEDGTIFNYTSKYNDSTSTWEDTLVETKELYFIERSSINDADTYVYGDISATFTNVPDGAIYSNFKYFSDDDTYTYGKLFFPNNKISKNILNVTNLGEDGYYSLDILNANKIRIAQAFFCIENGTVYSINYSINPDIAKVEMDKKAISSIDLNVFEVNTIDYVEGNISVPITEVPKEATNASISCFTLDGSYTTFNREVNVTNGEYLLDKLGMSGDYTVTFYNNTSIIGYAKFYIDDKYNLFEVKYTYEDNVEVKNLIVADSIKFISSSNSTINTIGDINFDEKVNHIDVLILKKYLLGIISMNSYQYNQSDMTADGKVNILDLIALKTTILNLE